jgi:CheY-like chemotaxis protein
MPRSSMRSPDEVPRVVVIDDDEFEREFVVDLLGKAGFKVSSLPSMIGVTNHLIDRRISVVVLDVMMPTIRGDKLATLLRKNPALRHLGVVMISGLPEHEVAPLMAQVEVDAFVSKANLRAELAATVARVIALKAVHA